MKTRTITTLAAGLTLAGIGIGAAPASAAGAEFIDLPPDTFPTVDPCTNESTMTTMTSQLQVVTNGTNTTLIFRSTATATDGSSARGIETRHLNGDSYDINLRFMASHPDGHRYTIVANLNGEGVPTFGEPTVTCIRP